MQGVPKRLRNYHSPRAVDLSSGFHNAIMA
jgi:hypothetical protein